MATNLQDFCYTLRDCATKLEEELKININDCNNMVTSGMGSEIKMALDMAKDIHYKEILKYMREILINIRKIIYHEEQIRSLSKKEKLSDEEIKKYSYVQRQVSKFDNKVVMRRERRRGVSNLSVGSLDAWERYMDQGKNEDINLATSLPCLIEPNGFRRKDVRKMTTTVSDSYSNEEGATTGTYSNEGGETSSLDSINEEGNRIFDSCNDINHRLCEIVESDDEKNTTDDAFQYEMSKNHQLDHNICIDNKTELLVQDIRPNIELENEELRSSFIVSDDEDIEIEEVVAREEFPIFDLVKSLSEEHLLDREDTKPKIVHVVYKNRSDQG